MSFRNLFGRGVYQKEVKKQEPHKLKKREDINEILKRDKADEVIEVLFTLDTTGSMGGLIETAKDKIWSIANKVVELKPKAAVFIGLLAYRDKQDDYITKITCLTDDLDDMYSELMEFKAAGGGDFPESVNQALDESVNIIQWTKEDVKKKQIIFLVGDAPPSFYKDIPHYEKTCKTANEKNIIINTLQCGNNGECKKHWVEIAKLGKGKFLPIDQQGGNVEIETPFDQELADLSKKMDNTRLYWGGESIQNFHESRKKKASSLYSKSKASSIASRAVYQNSEWGYKKNFLGKQELVNDFVEGNVSLDTIKDDHLPNEMKKMKKKEREEYLKKKDKERKEIKEAIDKLTIKRRDFIDEYKKKHKSELDKSFDEKVVEILKNQLS